MFSGVCLKRKVMFLFMGLGFSCTKSFVLKSSENAYPVSSITVFYLFPSTGMFSVPSDCIHVWCLQVFLQDPTASNCRGQEIYVTSRSFFEACIWGGWVKGVCASAGVVLGSGAAWSHVPVNAKTFSGKSCELRSGVRSPYWDHCCLLATSDLFCLSFIRNLLMFLLHASPWIDLNGICTAVTVRPAS